MLNALYRAGEIKLNAKPNINAVAKTQTNGLFQQSLQTVFDAVSAGLVAVSSDGCIAAVNHSFAAMGKTTVQKLIGKKASSALHFSGTYKYGKTRAAEVDAAEYQGQLSILGSNTVKVAYSFRRTWIDDHRVFILTTHKLDGLLFERQKFTNLQENLELKVKLRTVALANRIRELDMARAKLSATVQELRETQQSLLSAEKLAALGGLVAGIAHEVNTPLGIGVTASSHLGDSLKTMKMAYNDGSLTQDGMEEYIVATEEAAHIIMRNLSRASDLVRSFKQVAVDQSTEDIRVVNMKTYLEDILVSLRPQIKKTRHLIRLDCPSDLEIMTFPGALAQIITNLISNSLAHGFDGQSVDEVFLASDSDKPTMAGVMLIDVQIDSKNNVCLTYQDNGSGVPKNLIKTIFDPFVTSKREQGGTGLGLHILHNLVTQKLKGTVTCSSEKGQGARFDICWPSDPASNQKAPIQPPLS